MSSLFRRALIPGNIAMEGEADGKVRIENEHMWAAEMIVEGVATFPELAKAASWEFQDQWGMKITKGDKNAGAGQIRVRATYPGGEDFMNLGDPKYVHAVKVNAAGGGAYETEIEITPDYFKAFQILCDNGMQKDRYFFPVNGGVFEVDMFLLPGLAEQRLKGGKNRGRDYHVWCKIDYETADLNAPIPEMPFKVVQAFKFGRGVNNSAEENKILDKLFADVYVTPNPMKK